MPDDLPPPPPPRRGEYGSSDHFPIDIEEARLQVWRERQRAEQAEEERKIREAEQTEKTRRSGCGASFLTFLAASISVVLAGLLYNTLIDVDDCEAAASADLAAACEPSTEGGAEPAAAEESEPSEGQDAPEAEGGAGGGPDDSEPIAPPTEAELPEGAKLIQGSGGPIGCIPCDGGFRFLHPTNGGVTIGAVGSGAQSQQSLEITENSEITEFGVILSGADGGKWEFALHTGPAYVASCHVPQGSTQCKTDAKVSADGRVPLKPGDKLAVLVGNGGDPFTQGNFSAEWWIVFQPSA